MEPVARNDPLALAKLCKKNLLYIEQAYKSGEDVHLVTQILSSGLLLIVFPWEKNLDLRESPLLSVLTQSGWPTWDETRPSKKLRVLATKLRHAIAHANVQFSSDDREPSNVMITFRSENGDWQATISALDLRGFCLKYVEFLIQKSSNQHSI